MVNSRANTVASGSSVMPMANRNCEPKWMVLRVTCNATRRAETARMCAGLSAPSASRIANPPPLRIASISMMRSVPASARIDTAMAENDNSAPVIHRTTRMRSRPPALFGIRLKVRARGVERGKLGGCRVDGDDARKAIKRHLEAPGIGDLGHDADVRDRHVAPERIGRGLYQRLDRFEAGDDPVPVPFLDRALVGLEGVAQIAERAEIIERVDVAGNDLRHRPHVRPFDRVLRQQRRGWAFLLVSFH